MTHPEPRGIRNDNPGNIRYNDHIIWQGQTGHDDDGFVVFDAPYHGVRAMCVILTHYVVLDHCRCLADLINRWAPGNRNNTQAYISYVSDYSGVPPVRLPEGVDEQCKVIEAMIHFENGEQPYPRTLIERALLVAHKF